MKITVITVAYNSASTIEATLASVACQTHPDVEHLVIDGGSTDETAQIVSRFRHSVSHFVSERDGGIYDAMNKGLAKATGHLVGFLNADDRFADELALARIAAAATAHPSAVAVYGDLVYDSSREPGKIVRYWRSGRFSRSRLRFGWMPPHPTFYATRQHLREIGGFDTTLKIAADYEMMLRCLAPRNAQAAYVPEVLVRMRLGGASNRSASAMLRKSAEDLKAMRANRIGGPLTLLCKNLRKLPQFFRRARA